MTLSPEDQAYLEKLPGAGAFNPTVPHPARRYNYWLDGKDNFDADRRSADEIERSGCSSSEGSPARSAT